MTCEIGLICTFLASGMLFRLDSDQDYILYPGSVDAKPSVYQLRRLFNDLEEISRLPDSDLVITVDFRYCRFLNHIAVAYLGGLARLVESRNGRIVFDWKTLPKNIHANLAQNGFLFNFGCDRFPWDGNSVPYWNSCQHDPKDVGNYLRHKWLGKGWVNVSQGLGNAIAGNVSEIYLNAFEHSQSEIGVFSCGQHYPTLRSLHLAVIDFGIGIPTNVRSLPENASFSASETLSWAFQPGTTTVQDDIPRGLGLSVLQEFITKNQGSLEVFSNDGWVTVNNNGVSYKDTDINFPGTLVNIEVQCDEKYYCLASEVSSPTGRLLFS